MDDVEGFVEGIERARAHLGTLLEDAARRRPRVIVKGGPGATVTADNAALLLSLRDLAELLDGVEFHPEVLADGEGVAMWVPEFAIYGRGKDLPEALKDLVEEVRDYVLEYLEQPQLYRAAPNRASQYGHVLKAFAADLLGELDALFLSDPSGRGVAATA